MSEEIGTLKAETATENAAEAESKFKRIVVALTVGAVILLSVLIVFLSWQLIAINGKVREVNALKAKIAEVNIQLSQGEETLEIRRTKAWIEREARRLGYAYSDDVIFD